MTRRRTRRAARRPRDREAACPLLALQPWKLSDVPDPVERRPAPYLQSRREVPCVLEGERLVGRIEPKLQRERGELEVLGVWWEPGVKPTKARKQALDAALERLAAVVAATRVTLRRG